MIVTRAFFSACLFPLAYGVGGTAGGMLLMLAFVLFASAILADAKRNRNSPY